MLFASDLVKDDLSIMLHDGIIHGQVKRIEATEIDCRIHCKLNRYYGFKIDKGGFAELIWYGNPKYPVCWGFTAREGVNINHSR